MMAMKFRLGLLTLTALAPLAAHAQPVDGIYIGAGVGFDYLNSVNAKTLVIPSQALAEAGRSQTIPINSGKFKSDGGFVGLGSIGYGLGNGLRLEVEGDYRENHTRVEKGNGTSGGANFQQGGVFANALYDFDAGLGFIYPYAGVGVGYVQNTLQGGRLYTTNPTVPQVGVDFTNSAKGSAAGQVILGAAFPLTYALSLTTEFRFMGQFSQQTYNGKTTVNGGIGGGLPGTSLKIAAPTNESFLVGLRYSFDAAPPAPPMAPPPMAPPAPPPAKTYLVFFDWDKYNLTDRAVAIIAEAAANVPKVQVTKIEVNGHTDLSGTAAYNLKLSVRRADAVAAQLIKDGVPKGIIETHGYGEANPLVPTAQGVREPQNRRVEIIFK
jgi:OOP family OmpA-OmpF porin